MADEVGLGVGRPDRKFDCVTDLLAELLGDGRAQDDLVLRVGFDGVALRVGQPDGPPCSLGGVGSDDLIRDSEAEVELARLGIEGVAGERGHALDFFDLVILRDRQDWGRLPVGRPYLHARAEVGDAAIDQRVEILRERPHRGQGQHADRDAGDGQEAAELMARDVAGDFHETVENTAHRAKGG